VKELDLERPLPEPGRAHNRQPYIRPCTQRAEPTQALHVSGGNPCVQYIFLTMVWRRPMNSLGDVDTRGGAYTIPAGRHKEEDQGWGVPPPRPGKASDTLPGLCPTFRPGERKPFVFPGVPQCARGLLNEAAYAAGQLRAEPADDKLTTEVVS
jgi:hypothetical protein